MQLVSLKQDLPTGMRGIGEHIIPQLLQIFCSASGIFAHGYGKTVNADKITSRAI